MSKRLAWTLLWTLGVACAPVLGADARAKPLHLLLITADDLNGDSYGWMGNRLGATPNIDAFAATCFRFEQCHVSAPICQPSRSALMTGRVPHRNGALGFHPIRNDVTTLVDVLARKGYFTAVINKAPHMMPHARFAWDLRLDGSGKNPATFAAHVQKAFAAAAAQGKPIFLNANITDPHRPFPGTVRPNAKRNPPNTGSVKAYEAKDIRVPSFLEDIPDVRREVAQYYTAVRRFDMSFGEAMKALGASGQEKNTVVLYLSDHGMSFPFSKATVYRNGTWSPLLLRWPALAKPGVDRLHMVSSVDIMPTALELLGVPAPAGMDGRSLLPLLHGKKQADRDFVITHVNTVSSGRAFPARCVRTRTRSYLWQPWSDGTTTIRIEAMADRTFKALAAQAERDPRVKKRVNQFLYGVVEAVYDLEKDPDERINRIDDVSYRADRDRLRRLLLTHMEKTSDPQLAAFRKRLP